MRNLRPQSELERRTLALIEDKQARQIFFHQFFAALGSEGQQVFGQIIDRHGKKASQTSLAFANAIGARQLDATAEHALELATLMNFFDYRRSLLLNAIPATTLATMLGVSRQTVHERFRSGLLLGILDNNVLKFPEWQFDPNGPNGLVAGLPDILTAMSCDHFAKISWLASHNSIFNDARPIDVLKRGGFEEVLKEAQALHVS